jgi:hypothetical protein
VTGAPAFHSYCEVGARTPQDQRPRVVATIVAGRIVHLVDADRIVPS